MATLALVPGKTEAQLTARARGQRIPPALLNVPGGLFPLQSAAYEVDEYRILSGWPVPVPDCDIRIECLVSAEGDLVGNRDAPTALVTGADMRWVADTAYYDQVTLQWIPIQGSSGPWLTSVDHAPTMVTDYEYTVGDERFTSMTALNFDSNTNDYMWINLDLFMGGTSGYTVLMVLSPNSIYGNDDTVDNNALWGPDSITGAWSMFTVKDQAVWMRTEEMPDQKGVAIGNGLNSTALTYLAMVVGRPQTTLYAASGPSKVLTRALAAGAAPEPLSTRFWLGNGPFLDSATMDMALMDLSIYGKPLTKAEVVAEITTLSTVYGGDS
jgi:hypothetical protein